MYVIVGNLARNWSILTPCPLPTTREELRHGSCCCQPTLSPSCWVGPILATDSVAGHVPAWGLELNGNLIWERIDEGSVLEQGNQVQTSQSSRRLTWDLYITCTVIQLILKVVENLCSLAALWSNCRWICTTKYLHNTAKLYYCKEPLHSLPLSCGPWCGVLNKRTLIHAIPLVVKGTTLLFFLFLSGFFCKELIMVHYSNSIVNYK